jgi:DNA invertase Pin-like site-specific DNA recombinase
MRKPIAYGYCRVSSDGQDVTCAVQKKSIGNRFDLEFNETFEWGGFFVDPAVSGATEFADRPAGTLLLERLQDGDVIIVSKLDRISRNLKDFCGLMETLAITRTKIVAIDLGVNTLTDVGELLAKLMVAIAEWERKRTAERRTEGQLLARELGFFGGGKYAYVGFHKSKRRTKVQPHVEEQKLMRQVFEWFEQGYRHVSIYKHLRSIGVNDPKTQHPVCQRKVYSYVEIWPKIMGTEFDVTIDCFDNNKHAKRLPPLPVGALKRTKRTKCLPIELPSSLTSPQIVPSAATRFQS